MNLFFDTEFTGLHKDTTLVSIGIIAESGEIFYAEITDYDKSQVNPWLQENVIDKLFLNDKNSTPFKIFSKYFPKFKFVSGPKSGVSNELKKWLNQFDANDKIRFVSDVSHYDFVLLIDLFGSAFDLPENVCPACYDINQLIADKYNCTLEEAFDKSREELAKHTRFYADCEEIFNKSELKHNSLFDAVVIALIYDNLAK